VAKAVEGYLRILLVPLDYGATEAVVSKIYK
jgi:hypothetical protein